MLFKSNLKLSMLIAIFGYLMLSVQAATLYFPHNNTSITKRGFFGGGGDLFGVGSFFGDNGFIANAARPIISKVKNLFKGQGTYYDVTAGIGSCGKRDTNDELVVAINEEQMTNGPNPNTNPKCDRMVTITGPHGTTEARVVDTCPTCERGALDMSPTVFKLVCGQLSIGVCNINWKYI